ncbi:MAG: response regulator [Verrucomicrobia bacterium]|nr:response regulator [Verrucomicrobiota bacterium]
MINKTVLYVEDDEHDVFFVKRAFEHLSASHCLRVVRNGLNAMDYLAGTGRFDDRQRYPEPSLVLLDLKLPGKRGMEVLEWIRQQERFQTLPVVIFTASDLEFDRRKNMERGATDYIVKPADMNNIPAILTPILKRYLKVETSEREDA